MLINIPNDLVAGWLHLEMHSPIKALKRLEMSSIYR